MTLETFINILKNSPKKIEFSDTMHIIESNYVFTPTAFKNGKLQNKASENLGSCKLLAFSKLQGFTKEEALACFGQYYFEDVLKDSNGIGHQNIRNFMNTGFDGLTFEGEPLTKK